MRTHTHRHTQTCETQEGEVSMWSVTSWSVTSWWSVTLWSVTWTFSFPFEWMDSCFRERD